MISRSQTADNGDPIEEWLRAPAQFTNTGPIDPLLFWQQKLDAGGAGSHHLAQMALDVLSCPGEFL